MNNSTNITENHTHIMETTTILNPDLLNTEEQSIDNMNILQRLIKRFGDIVCSFFGLIILSPVFAIIAIKQKMSSEGPIFFKQERIGKNGKPFNIIKFRTMVVDAEDDGPALAKDGDDRLTKFGKFLREHHLDELPQLWNVLVGDMSLVGYRPERQFYIDQIMQRNPDYQLLYCSRPGVTSYATVYNGYTDTIEKMLTRLDMDLEYLRKRTLLLDIKIIFQTVFQVGKGEKI